ncbi:EAL domain-containing protein (putative c-di-GMP-specific phosphodiesterase class I) [Marinobacterium halophilum]|uniref:EAL domain-containing protein (Putative c-di-GMP-specific phosphodiesterase class I) n=1 Tax=Marinobacterium halophilum TaxID=267374 RepID=A0A2P8EWQ5_9GAMM|nr:EAL domain-containing protein [Marinobacterium halophilum]PSL13878.1 EAL domain-containing protein (putative c-di-GMP-specific phosphodiesterase class I) [Marinobacterium halophilum]
MLADELFEFRPPLAPTASQEPPWKVLSVEDDPTYQASLVHALAQIKVDGRSLEVICARSAVEAARLLPEHQDIGIIMLDVVMEDDDSGLRLVRTIRDVICNNQVRIVLLTGQPGMAPQPDVLRQFDIDDYWCKSELTHEHLTSVITGNLRTWDRTTQLERARQGLQLIVDASQALSKRRDLASYTHTVLSTLSVLLRVDHGGILCILSPPGQPLSASRVLAASGCFKHCKDRTLDSPEIEALHPLFAEALATRHHLYNEHYTVLHFAPDQVEAPAYLTLIKTDRKPTPAETNLLEVFCENISTGFTNLSLYNRMSQLAYRDPLLDMPNRNYLKRTLRSLSTRELHQHLLWVIKFDELNETALHFGEPFCDSVLHSVQHRLQTRIQGHLLLARIDRSTFALLLPADTAPSKQQVAALLAEPLTIDGSEHQIPSVAAVLPLSSSDNHEPEHMLRLAELTVEAAKRNGLRFVEYDRSQEQQMRERYILLNELRQALQTDALHIVLQPKVELISGRAVGFEALVRWQHADGHIINPDQFIPVAETAGLISELDLNVLGQTLSVARSFQQQGITLPISFNTSSIDLLLPGYFDEMLSMIRASGLPPELLELEVTESQAMVEYRNISLQLRQLLEYGIGVSIDDFGTGYSSLAHITDLAASVLKIDRTFISRLGESENADHIVDMILRLGDRFGFQVIAEGVETEQQRQLLIDKGCLYAQGYLFARPMKPEQALEWVRNRR